MALETVHDLFRRHREKATGHWRVGGARTVYFDSGDVVFASSTFPGDRLTVLMVEQGKLTQDQMDHALANLKPGMSVGKNLIEMGFITQRDLLDMARLQVERIVWSAMLAEEPPVFDSREELEETIVRLPLDTPELLFKGMMRMPDRESLLEMLGPLNQVVLLQGRRVYDIDLPTELRKLAPLMDGSHTILELSGESGVEPMKIGAFALFLREIGWGKLFELPPLDRKAITKALDPPDPTRPPPSARSQLFNVIEEAGKPTTNLEHLSAALDKPTTNLEHLSAVLDGAANVVGQARPPEPTSVPEPTSAPELVPEPLGSPEELEEPEELQDQMRPLGAPPPSAAPVPIGRPIGRVLPYAMDKEDAPPEEPPVTIIRDGPSEGFEKEDEDYNQPKQKRKGPAEKEWGVKKKSKALPRLLLFVAILLALLSAAYYYVWALKSRDADPPFTLEPEDGFSGLRQESAGANQPSQPAQSEVPPAPPSVLAPSPPLATERETRPGQPSPAPPDITREARYGALANGNISRALEQGAAFQSTLPKGNWTIRLIVACQGDNIQYCAYTLGPSRPELFLRPFRLRDGRQCYQLFVGRFPNKGAAEAEMKKILPLFVERRVDSKVVQISEISENQTQ